MNCPSCGRNLGEGTWRACPGCGADLTSSDPGKTASMQPVPGAPPRSTAYPPYRSPEGQPYADPRTGQSAGPYYDPRTGRYVQPYFDPRAGQYPPAYDPRSGVAYGPYPGAYSAPAARRGSVALGLLTVLLGGLVAGSTFLPWISVHQPGAALDVTGWFTMNTGVESLGGGGFHVVIAEQGAVFFTGFFSLLLGVLMFLCGLIMLVRRRGAGIASLLFSMTAASLAAVNIAMIYAKIEASTGWGLWGFAAASVLSIVLAIIAVY